jgi:hypothetical protein
MPEPIRLVLMVDEPLKNIIEEGAAAFTEGNSSAYIRGLIVFHQILRNKGTGEADIPGWVFGNYPVPLIQQLRKEIEQYKRDQNKEAASDNPFLRDDFMSRLVRAVDADRERLPVQSGKPTKPKKSTNASK